MSILVAARYQLLVFPKILHPFPYGYLKTLPKFNGNGSRIAYANITTFQDFIDNLLIKHDDVFMWMFLHCLEVEA
jgi:hypothetical protein